MYACVREPCGTGQNVVDSDTDTDDQILGFADKEADLTEFHDTEARLLNAFRWRPETRLKEVGSCL